MARGDLAVREVLQDAERGVYKYEGRIDPSIMLRPSTLSALIVLSSCTVGNEAGPLHHPDLSLEKLAEQAEGSNQLFDHYHASGAVKWNQGWPWQLDLSGVAWDRSNTATAITPRHVVMASHYPRKQGEELVFHDRTGRRHVRTVEKVVHFRERGAVGDVAVGLLDSPLPRSIRTYPLPKERSDDGQALIGALALVTEQRRALYFHRISRVHAGMLGMTYDRKLPESRRKPLVTGDSGHPSFILSKGELVLVETHTTGASGAGPFYGSATVLKAIREIAQELDPSHSLRTIEMDSTTLASAKAGRKALPNSYVPQAKPSTSPTQPRPEPTTMPPAPRKPRPRVVVPSRTPSRE